MANKGFELTHNQLLAARRLYRAGNLQDVNGNTIKSLVNKGVIEQKPKSGNWSFYSESFQFTPDGQAWADVQFGSPDPDDDDSDPDPTEPLTARDAMLASEPVLAGSWNTEADESAFAALGERVSRYLVINRVIDTEPMECDTIDETLQVLYELREDGESLINWLVQEWQGDSLIESVFANIANVTPHKAGEIVTVSGVQHEVQANGIMKQLPPKPVSGVTWLTRDEAMKFPFANKEQSLYWHGEVDYLYRYRHNAPQPAKLPRKSSVQAKKVTLPNMQRRNAPKAVKVAKPEPTRETVLQIVSRVMTPLSSGARRVA